MKKLFICVMTSLCSTFAFADADLVVKPATISNGNGTMQVVINKAGQTAFQFDVKLPAGVSATAFTLTGAPESRKFEKAEYEKTIYLCDDIPLQHICLCRCGFSCEACYHL